MLRMIEGSLFRSAAVTGIASALVLALVSAGANAKPPPNPFPVSCSFSGTFFPPVSPGAGGALTSDALSTALGDCKALGAVNQTGILEVDGNTYNSTTGCSNLKSIGHDMVMFNKKGDGLYYLMTGSQCLRTANNSVANPAGTFCGTASSDPHSSYVSANVAFIDGTGILAGAVGGGTLTGTVDHCATKFPFGNTFNGSINGSVTLP